MTLDQAGSRIGLVATIFSRQFWTLKAINALLGFLITIGSGLAQLGVGDGIRQSMENAVKAEQAAQDGIRVIDAAVFEFKLFESDSALVQVLTATGAIDPRLRDQMRALTITNRRHAFLVILSQLHPEVDDFTAAREEYDRLVAGSIAWDKALADRHIAFEAETIIAAHELQKQLVDRLYRAKAAQQELRSDLDRYTVVGTTAQMLGLLVVLFGGLLADHLAARPRPA
jgi:parvulin-like peptidyl-prolyl isomerase